MRKKARRIYKKAKEVFIKSSLPFCEKLLTFLEKAKEHLPVESLIRNRQGSIMTIKQ
ncbi:MAG: hypothetical protein LBK58_14475 [Prevotellaceae bacterium]|jgi:hypothetical protein|nr:hypothetical protein [Prevotellaceae bacterium]